MTENAPQFSSQERSKIVRTCFQCGVCSGACPKARVVDGFLPRRLVLEMVSGHEQRVIDSKLAWQCLTCGQCQELCPMHLGLLTFVRSLREQTPPEDVPIHLAHENVMTPLSRLLTNPNLKPKKSKLLSKELLVDSNSDTLFFLGCIPYLDSLFRNDVGFEGMQILNSALSIMNRLGLEPAVTDDEVCCGHDLLWRGSRKEFQKLGEHNIEHLSGYKEIITTCPECVRTMTLDYEELLGKRLPVRHISEWVFERIDDIPRGNSGATATFHDSCRLGRHLGVFEPPRQSLRRVGYSLREMPSSLQESSCCGVSAWIRCDYHNKEIRRERLREAVQTGAQTMVTACPKCQIHLKCLQRDVSEPEYPVNITDFAVAILEAMQKDDDSND